MRQGGKNFVSSSEKKSVRKIINGKNININNNERFINTVIDKSQFLLEYLN